MDAVIFDLFGVLIRLPAARDQQRLRILAGLPEPEFTTVYWVHRPGYDRGELDSAGYWARVGAAAGRRYDAARVQALVRADTAMWARPSRMMVRLLLDLRAAGVPTAILSNVPADIWHCLRERHGWLHAPAVATVSFQAGAVKPEPAIYHRCLAALGVGPGQALFVDDRAENVAAARRLGLRARRVTRHGQPLLAVHLRRSVRLATREQQRGAHGEHGNEHRRGRRPQQGGEKA